MVRHLVRVLKDTEEMSRSLASYLGTVARLFPVLCQRARCAHDSHGAGPNPEMRPLGWNSRPAGHLQPSLPRLE